MYEYNYTASQLLYMLQWQFTFWFPLVSSPNSFTKQDD